MYICKNGDNPLEGSHQTANSGYLWGELSECNFSKNIFLYFLWGKKMTYHEI